jgi:TPR repeat protein
VTFELFQRSAELGNVASLLSMADAYYYGQGIPQDWARAAAIYYEVRDLRFWRLFLGQGHTSIQSHQCLFS